MIIKTLLTTHIIFSILLIFFILLNKGKGSEIGTSFGNFQENIFNNQNSSSLIKKIIILLSIIIVITSLSSSYINKIEKKQLINDKINQENIIQ